MACLRCELDKLRLSVGPAVRNGLCRLRRLVTPARHSFRDACRPLGADALQQAHATAHYYRQVRAAMGEARTAGFLRYYEISDYNHALSTVFNAAWDAVTALENRGEQGVTPARIVADTAGMPGSTRPLCEYPTWPKYMGSGNVNAASSFACALC